MGKFHLDRVTITPHQAVVLVWPFFTTAALDVAFFVYQPRLRRFSGNFSAPDFQFVAVEFWEPSCTYFVFAIQPRPQTEGGLVLRSVCSSFLLLLVVGLGFSCCVGAPTH